MSKSIKTHSWNNICNLQFHLSFTSSIVFQTFLFSQWKHTNVSNKKVVLQLQGEGAQRVRAHGRQRRYRQTRGERQLIGLPQLSSAEIIKGKGRRADVAAPDRPGNEC